MQIVVLAIFTGVVLLMLGEQTRHMSYLIDESTLLVQTMLRLVSQLIPLFVFVSMLRLFMSGTVGNLIGLWKPFFLAVGIAVLVSVILVIAASIRVKVSPMIIFRKLLPPVIIAISTASSVAAYPSALDTGENKLGIRRSLLDIGFPIGVVIYMPSIAVYFASLCLYLAEVYHVEVTLSWLIMDILISAILAIAVPPLPGAMMTCYSILLTQLGIPSEGLLLATALNIIMDFIFAGFIIANLLVEMIMQADVLDMLDRETLRG